MRAPLLVAVLALAVSLACSSAEERAESARQAALSALQRGERSRALAAIEALREAQPESAEALVELTRLLVAAGEAAQAVWVLQDGLRRFPDRDDVRIALARAALLTNDAVLARSVLQEIASTSDAHPEGLILLAQAELALGDLERALEILAAGALRYPDRPEMKISRIATLIRERRLEDASRAIRDARRSEDDGLDPATLARVRELEASLYGLAFSEGLAPSDEFAEEPASELSVVERQARAAANREHALGRLRELVAEDETDLELWRAATDAYWKAGRADEAIALIRARLSSHADQVGLYPYLSQLERVRGRPVEAEAAMREFAERSNSPSGHLALARFHSGRGSELEMLAVLDEGLERFPGTALLLKARTESLIGMERLDEARAALSLFEAAAPGAPEIEFLRAQLELVGGDPEGAAERLLRLVPDFDNAGTQFWLGRALERLGDNAGAERRYRLAFTRQPDEPILSRAVMHMAELRGDWQLVIAYGQRLLMLDPLAEDAWEALLRAVLQLDQAAAAVAISQRGVALFPESPRLHAFLVRALVSTRKFDEALAHANFATEKLGENAEIEAERALALGIRGDVAAGAAAAAAALARHPDSSRLYLASAALAFAEGDESNGSAAVDRALALAPDDPNPYRLRAEFRASRGLFVAAEADCRAYLAQRPDDATMHHVLGVVLAGAGRTDDAIRAYERAAELDRDAWAPRNNLAEVLRERGDVEGALAFAQKAFALAQGNPYVADTLGWLYLEKGLVKRSLGLLEEAHAGAPDHPVVGLHLALAYRADGRRDDARGLLTDLELRTRENGDLHAEVLEALHSLEE